MIPVWCTHTPLGADHTSHMCADHTSHIHRLGADHTYTEREHKSRAPAAAGSELYTHMLSRGNPDLKCMDVTVKELGLKRRPLSFNESQDVLGVISSVPEEGFQLHPIRRRLVPAYSKPGLAFQTAALSEKVD